MCLPCVAACLVVAWAIGYFSLGLGRGTSTFLRTSLSVAVHLATTSVASGLPIAPRLVVVLVSAVGFYHTLGSPMQMLNFLVLQWVGLRLTRFGVLEVTGEDLANRRLGTWVSVHWRLERWIWPLTGWWSPLRWIRRVSASEIRNPMKGAWRWWT